MTRKELIESNTYWKETIEILLYHKNFKGKNRRKDLIDKIIEMKNELIENYKEYENTTN